MKTFLYIGVGMVFMFVILKVLSTKKPVSKTETITDFRNLLKTPEASKLISSPEFADVLLTSEFKTVAKNISGKYLRTITQSLLA